ncbi:hypothetical protein WMY93_012789 [Mugilogobius chulae]|uniref:Uncharacterized protein n=1 Tax=Mugilogobius chulae TaxID=88201 RepID=A0AAW0NZS7_9GOBI
MSPVSGTPLYELINRADPILGPYRQIMEPVPLAPSVSRRERVIREVSYSAADVVPVARSVSREEKVIRWSGLFCALPACRHIMAELCGVNRLSGDLLRVSRLIRGAVSASVCCQDCANSSGMRGSTLARQHRNDRP